MNEQTFPPRPATGALDTTPTEALTPTSPSTTWAIFTTGALAVAVIVEAAVAWAGLL